VFRVSEKAHNDDPRKAGRQSRQRRPIPRPTSPEGLERVREANLLHGFYSKSPYDCMRALGENPEDFESLLASLNDVWQPRNDYERSLVLRLARLTWRLDRADRVQEAMAIYQVETLQRNIDRQEEEDAVRQKDVLAALDRLLKAAEYCEFSTGELHWHDFEQAYGDKPQALPAGRGKRIWLRLAELTHPHRRESEAGGEDGGGSPALVDGNAREKARADLRSLLRQEIEARNQAYQRQREERTREYSPAFHGAYMMPNNSRLHLAMRAENSAFNQMRHVTEMLVKLKAQAARGARQKSRKLEDEGESHDVIENKGSGSEAIGESHDIAENKQFS
jgi:hypothetical protein